MTEPEMDAALVAQENSLRKAGMTDSVIRAYQALMPLLWENQAILRYQTEVNPAYNLTPIETTAEAIRIAYLEYRLTKTELRALSKALVKIPDEALQSA